VIFVHHADHVFWLGVSITDTLMSMRESGEQLAITRRGISHSRCTIMTRPLRFRERTLSRVDAKRQYGIDPGQFVILTAADAPKYRGIGGTSFLDLLLPVVERHPHVVLLAAGPSEDDEWRAASGRTGGRVRALGRLPDVAPLHQLADFYVDSFPFSSLTSLLEAGAYGTPVASFDGHPPDCAVLGADTPGVDEHLVKCRDLETFAARLSELIVDDDAREQLGRRTEAAVRGTHTGAGWSRQLERLYAFALDQPPPVPISVPERNPGHLDILLDLVMERTGLSDGGAGALARNIALLPAHERAVAWWSRLRQKQSPDLIELVPEWVYPYIGDSKDLLRRWIR
jgi:hypothetical protein